MTTLELNPIRMRPDRSGPAHAGRLRLQVRLRPRRPALAAPRTCRRTCSPSTTPTSSRRSTSCAPTRARATSTSSTPKGTILAPTFGGGANSLVTEMLGDDAIISSDFGGNPPYEKMKEVARICFKHWLEADQRAVHHRRQVQQHRHLRDLPRDGRRAARAFQPARADAALRGDRPRRAEPRARHGRDARHAARRSACRTAFSASTRT